MNKLLYIIIAHHKYGFDVLEQGYSTEDEAHAAGEAWYREYMDGRGYSKEDIDEALRTGEDLDDETYYSVSPVKPPQ